MLVIRQPVPTPALVLAVSERRSLRVELPQPREWAPTPASVPSLPVVLSVLARPVLVRLPCSARPLAQPEATQRAKAWQPESAPQRPAAAAQLETRRPIQVVRHCESGARLENRRRLATRPMRRRPR